MNLEKIGLIIQMLIFIIIFGGLISTKEEVYRINNLYKNYRLSLNKKYKSLTKFLKKGYTYNFDSIKQRISYKILHFGVFLFMIILVLTIFKINNNFDAFIWGGLSYIIYRLVFIYILISFSLFFLLLQIIILFLRLHLFLFSKFIISNSVGKVLLFILGITSYIFQII